MKKVTLIGLAGASVVIAGAFLFWGHQRPKKLIVPFSGAADVVRVSVRAPNSVAGKGLIIRSSGASDQNSVRPLDGSEVSADQRAALAGSGAEAGLGAGIAAGAGAARATGRGPFKYQRELDDFAFLKKKVFLSDDEKDERRQLLQNENLLHALGEMLKVPAGSAFEAQAETNLALDILFDALHGQASEVAQRVLQELIQDQSVENSQMAPEARHELAGVKAEVLYQWSSQDPSRMTEMKSWLPGPVSQKIWKNVVAAQQSNYAESSAEAAAYRRTSQPQTN